MRIIGHIDHPDWKITVFKMDNRLSVKLETGLYEQIYKFRQGEGMDTMEDISAFLDQDFLAAAARHFSSMHQARLAAQARKDAAEGEESFDEII
jgi:hypothetical protein